MKLKFLAAGVAAFCAATFSPFSDAVAAPFSTRQQVTASLESSAPPQKIEAVKNTVFVVTAQPTNACQKAVNSAYGTLIDAKNAGKNREENDPHYAKATEELQKLAEENPESPEVLALLGHVYRHRGSAVYAQDYFKKAVACLSNREDIVSRLKLAILYAAGDAKYGDNAATWRDYGLEMVDIIKRDIGKLKSNLSRKSDNNALARLLMAEAMCEIIGGDSAQAAALLQSASELSLSVADKTSVKDYRDLWMTVGEGRWLWETTEKGANDEYLLAYCFDSGVYFAVDCVEN